MFIAILLGARLFLFVRKLIKLMAPIKYILKLQKNKAVRGGHVLQVQPFRNEPEKPKMNNFHVFIISQI